LRSNKHAIVIISFQDHTCQPNKTEIITRHTSPERKFTRRSIVQSQLTELDVQHILEGGEHGLNRKNLIELNKCRIRDTNAHHKVSHERAHLLDSHSYHVLRQPHDLLMKHQETHAIEY